MTATLTPRVPDASSGGDSSSSACDNVRHADGEEYDRGRSSQRSSTRANTIAQRLIVWMAVIGAVAFSAIGIVPITLALLANAPWITEILQQHFAATVGLPSMAGLSFLIVLTLEARFNQIEMEFFGVVRFRGGAGPIIMWGFCFLAMAAAVKLLW